MAMGVIQSAIGLFGNVPCPIIYGAIVDSACLLWKSVCGKHGACSLYDADTFRHYFLGEYRSDFFMSSFYIMFSLYLLQALRLALCFWRSSWIWSFGARRIASILRPISRMLAQLVQVVDQQVPPHGSMCPSRSNL